MNSKQIHFTKRIRINEKLEKHCVFIAAIMQGKITWLIVILQHEIRLCIDIYKKNEQLELYIYILVVTQFTSPSTRDSVSVTF